MGTTHSALPTPCTTFPRCAADSVRRVCVPQVYKLSEKNLMPFYQRVAKETQLRVLVYNGGTQGRTWCTATPCASH